MVVCKKCLMAIESREGNQIHRHLDYDRFYELSNGEEELECEWCNEMFDCSDLVEI